MALAT